MLDESFLKILLPMMISLYRILEILLRMITSLKILRIFEKIPSLFLKSIHHHHPRETNQILRYRIILQILNEL